MSGVPNPRASGPGPAPTWVSAVDPESGRRWRFDVGFMTSHWRCIYGAGCRGLASGQDPARFDGCCTEGAALTDADDFVTVRGAVARLDPARWQFAAAAKRTGWFKRYPNGRVGTRVTNGACIFLNRPGFVTGPGCALHIASLAAGERPLDGKPNVCWQFPLRRDLDTDDDGEPVSSVRAWRIEEWEIRAELHWWCTDTAEAFDAPDAVWRTLEAELRAMAGDAVYEQLATALGGPGK